GARLAVVIVRVNEVDPEGLQALQGLPGACVIRQPGPDLGIVQGDRGQEDATAVQEEVPAVDPELAKAEAHGEGGIQQLAPSFQQGKAQEARIFWRMEVP